MVQQWQSRFQSSAFASQPDLGPHTGLLFHKLEPLLPLGLLHGRKGLSLIMKQISAKLRPQAYLFAKTVSDNDFKPAAAQGTVEPQNDYSSGPNKEAITYL